MSWTDVFPVFTEDQVDEFLAEATLPEKAQLEEWYGIERVINSQPEKREIVSVSLFWKNVRAGDPDLPTPTKELLQNAVELGLAERFNPWDHYILPLLTLAPGILENNPEATIRVHLAKDLEFLVDELVEAGLEVYLMKSSSINFAPGGLWRFLPFSEEGKLVTISDTDRLNEIESDLIRTRTMAQSGVGAWRVPVPTDLTGDFRVCYLPFMGCQFGVQGGIFEVRELLDAFTWQAQQGKVEGNVLFPNCGPLPILSQLWPSYGFDEFFMNVAAYPRIAQHGMHTYVPGSASSQLLTLDIEYCTWGNPASEVVYFPGGSCCGQIPTHVPEGEAPPFEVVDEEMKEAAEIPAPPMIEPKIAFLLLTRDEVNHSEIWEDYLTQAGDRAGVFAHPKNPEILKKDSWLREHLIDDLQETEWAGVSIVRATLALLKAAVDDGKFTHFLLVSESCVPVRPFEELSRSLTLDPRTRMFVKSWHDERKHNILRAQRVENLKEIRKELAHFQAQWMCLSREDADLICENDLTESFENCFAPDEFYFATALAVLGRPPLHSVANRHLTWTDWSAIEKKHPGEFTLVTPLLAARIAESGCFFARKFPADSNIGSFNLHCPLKH